MSFVGTEHTDQIEDGSIGNRSEDAVKKQQSKDIDGYFRHSKQWDADGKIYCSSPDAKQQSAGGTGDKISCINVLSALTGNDFISYCTVIVIGSGK